MIKTRIVGVILVKDSIAVQSIRFSRYLPIGSPEIAINYLNRWGIDEIVILNINSSKDKTPFPIEHIQSYAKHCRTPLAIGGGITQLTAIKKIIQAGADKVVLNSALINNPEIISEAANRFGTQSIIISIDAKRNTKGDFEVCTHSGKVPTGFSVQELASRAENLGAGEILINSIDNDGMKDGYDLELLESIMNTVTIPIVICGGMSQPLHMHQAIKYNVSGVAAANFFHFTEHSVITLKQCLKLLEDPIRIDTYVTYEKYYFQKNGRIQKQEDTKLDSLRFKYIPEESI